MTERMDDTQKALMNALENMKRDIDESRIKRENKLWNDIDDCRELKCFLSKMTKDELSGIRQIYNLKGLSSLKKNDLIEKIQENMIENDNAFFSCFDNEQYKLIKKLVNNDGLLVLNDSLIHMHQVEYYRKRSIAFSGTVAGEKVLIMPNEMVAKFKELDYYEYHKLVEQNTRWKRVAHGLLYYYGVLGSLQLFNIMRNYFSSIQEHDFIHVNSLIDDAIEYHKCIKRTEYAFSYVSVLEPLKVLQEHKKRPTLEYFPFTYKQLYDAGVPNFTDKSLAHRKFVDYIVGNYDIPRESAEELVEECVYAIRIGEQPQRIIEFLSSQLEVNRLEVLQGFANQIMFLHNNTKQWVLKGYSPEEIFQEERKNLQPLPEKVLNTDSEILNRKIGRNDPCPCGSGKKYKKCCGKN